MDGETEKMIDFLREIGLGVRLTEIGEETFVPGISLEPGGLAIDLERLRYPGDLLHEAGHLATMLPSRRATTSANAGSDMGAEIAAQCWSYAAALHLGIDPKVVFHEHGYYDAADTLIATYRAGNAGVFLLEWMGMTVRASPNSPPTQPVWPQMVRWLREEPESVLDAVEPAAGEPGSLQSQL